MVDIFEDARTDWDELVQFLPDGWEDKVKELGLLKFSRKFTGKDGPSRLLRTLLIHLSGNISLRSTSALVKKGNIADISDVGILKRLKKSSNWFTWATKALLESMAPPFKQSGDTSYNFRFVDASVIEEPGATGSKWRLHYSFNATSFAPDEVIVGDYRQGEKLSNFSVNPQDVMVGDRAYGTRNSVYHAHVNNAFTLVRFAPHNLPLHDANGNSFQLLAKMKKLKIGEVGDYACVVKVNDIDISGRICVLRKTKEQAKKAQEKARRDSAKKKHKLQSSTLEYAKYITVFTTLPDSVSAASILEIYRHRWQVELVFKRLKSLLRLAPLYKKSTEGMMGWMSGKLFVATLTEYMLTCAKSFFPWGYPSIAEGSGRNR